jgi:hypothetical protein
MSSKQKQQSGGDRLWKYIGVAVLVVFIGSILWSMWAETLYPLIKAGDWRAVILHLIGLPVILVGVSIFVYGGYLFVIRTFACFGEEKMIESMAVIRSKSSRQEVTAARWQTLRFFWRAWKPGLMWLALGFLILAAGGFLINL